MGKLTQKRNIDANKLKEELKKHGGHCKIAKEIGFDTSYFTNVFNRGEMREATVQLLESKGIKYETYKPEEKKPEEHANYDFTHTKYNFSREITTADIVAELIEIRELIKLLLEALK